MSALFAFLHHIAAFTLIASLASEFVLLRETLTLSIARKLQIADMVFGLSAAAVLAVGLLRVFYFEKGASYYFSSVPFMLKLTLFILIGVLSIYPTVEFLSWKRSIQGGQAPVVAAGKLRRLRAAIHMELAAAVALVLCAALMARGVGEF
ncbi:DUF2214 family protein [Pollutimonas bauzanensis]|uniref:Putative membrane protein n=1 Tax=Pollutimonas bauzanensis TaxID=658167 RepID=A0A1M5ZJG4_9BURK|nr:DUF2214 family protein [Pollutimonas bauzanensis]SHI24083.1 putative membrane protein [Pollutimonas bauzanensis]